jgi:hypothetical protein
MVLPLPSCFHSVLTDDRLRMVAGRLLEVRYTTVRELNTPLDDNYVRETATFGRSRNALIAMARSPQFPWLHLRNAALDVTCEIEGILFRFFRDDPDSPGKLGFFRRNAVESLFETDDQTPVLWRFVIERAGMEDEEDQVHFVGYNAYSEKVSQWTLLGGAAGALVSVDKNVPPPKELGLPPLELQPEEDEQGGEQKHAP